MIEKLFDYEGWDVIDDLIYQFYEVTLNVDVGEFGKGCLFDEAILDFEKGAISLYKDKVEYIYKLNLVVGEKQ